MMLKPHDHHIMKLIPIYVCFYSLIFLLLLLLLPQSSHVEAQNSEVQALLSIKNAVGGSTSNITTWDSSASNPCNWTGVTCSSFNRVIALNVSGFGLQGTLPSDSFTSLTALTSLDLYNNFLSSPLPSMSMLTQLHDLNLSMNAFNEEFPKDILNFKGLVLLHMSNNKFQGAVPEGISALSNLQELWLGNNSLTSLPKSLSSLVQLTVLTAWSNSAIEMTLPPEWGAWVNLTYLNLHTIRLTGTLPSEWGAKFTKLQRLHLYNNDLRGSIPESWKGMTANLKELRMSNNELSGIVPSWIGDLQNTADKVEFKCNFLQGPHPSSFNDSTTWKGNCFDTDSGSHQQICDDKISCKDFFAKKKSFPIGAIIGIVIGVMVMILCGITALVWWLRPFSTTHRRRRRNDEASGDWEVPPGVKRYTYKEITKATKSFSKDCEIGEGGFGKVYVAHLDNKQVAIKRASDVSFQGIKEFRNELMLLSRLHHRHLVHLEGFCDDKHEQILIYEYMKNGNLHRHLFDKDALTLNWYRRLEIALNVAQGLDYLHTFADPPVIHRDVKPSNILLDSNMTAKVSDFGISKTNPEMDTHVSTRPAGTAGYLDPEYFLRRQLTTASDVYGYGVVLLELLTGQVAIDHRRTEDYNLVGWVKGKLKWNGDPRAIIDARLGSKYPVDEYKEVIEIALQCTTYDRNDRPKMQTVVERLEQILRRLQPPPEHMMILPPPSPILLPHSKELSQNTNSLNDIKITYASEVEPR